MIPLVNKLINFVFTRTDAQVGYKIAKEISLSRSSVYASNANLYKHGQKSHVDGETIEYEA